ncbi:hypothetical protein SAMN04488058_10761 [Deinococcus reticulitermitis]|uniref:Uncharacterized protein n=1 Tax=Deinococcus reticulitermitis TaxID=856736 RepID=A0A1H6YC61_9DEIO|nr:hypothetical protein [Deinococcus reticulitermitis]SEJ38841.1 hypothetical protein SAMN04488058_10761 [Deinococcus reticulitermitis]
MPFRLPLLTGLLLASALSFPAAAQTGPVTPLERELVQRALNPGGGDVRVKVEVRPGRLPDGFSLALPVGHRLIGSVVTTSGGPELPASAAVYFDTSLSPAQLTTTLATAFTRAGWQPMPEGPGYSERVDAGFLPSIPQSQVAWYRRSPDQTLFVQAQAAGPVTQVTLRQQDAPNLARQLEFMQSGGPLGRLPKLTPPSGSVVPYGWGGSGEGVTQQARIDSDLSRDALLEHYAAQLRRAGWVLVNRGQAGRVSSTVWSVGQGDKTQLGLLILTEVGKGQYRGTLSLNSQ